MSESFQSMLGNGMAMRIPSLLVLLALTLAVSTAVQEVGATEEEPLDQNPLENTTLRSAEAQSLVILVDKAAALAATGGRAVIADFRQKDTEWYTGRTYIFVDDMQGMALVNPPQTHIEGQSLIDMKDVNGKAVMREMIDLLRNREAGWLEYAWPKPGETVPSRKATYIRRVTVGGETLVVGAGLYLD